MLDPNGSSSMAPETSVPGSGTAVGTLMVLSSKVALRPANAVRATPPQENDSGRSCDRPE